MATIVTVGKSMGEGNSKKAALYFKLTAIYSCMLNLVVGMAIFLFRE